MEVIKKVMENDVNLALDLAFSVFNDIGSLFYDFIKKADKLNLKLVKKYA